MQIRMVSTSFSIVTFSYNHMVLEPSEPTLHHDMATSPTKLLQKEDGKCFLSGYCTAAYDRAAVAALRHDMATSPLKLPEGMFMHSATDPCTPERTSSSQTLHSVAVGSSIEHYSQSPVREESPLVLSHAISLTAEEMDADDDMYVDDDLYAQEEQQQSVEDEAPEVEAELQFYDEDEGLRTSFETEHWPPRVEADEAQLREEDEGLQPDEGNQPVSSPETPRSLTFTCFG